VKKTKLYISLIRAVIICSSLLSIDSTYAQSAMINVASPNTTLLNGQWKVIIDPTGIGDWRQVWKEKKPGKKTDFIEYSFKGGPILHVQGDFNLQMCELTYMEGTVWYKKTFSYNLPTGKRLFLHFGAVNYCADIYLNGNLLGSQEGGFTPFQFEITNAIHTGENTIIVKVNSQRVKNGLPGLGYDWFNYGGITRDVDLIETGDTYIEDYSIQLKKVSLNSVLGWVQLNGVQTEQNIVIKIPELQVYSILTKHQPGWLLKKILLRNI